MTPASFATDVDDALDHFMSSAVTRAEDLWDLDGETAFRRRSGSVETFDAELGYTGGQP